MAETKQKDKFEAQWKQFLTLTNSTTPEKPVKIENNDVLAIFAEVTKKRETAAKEAFKVKLEGILEAKLKLDQTLRAGREELVKKEEKEYEALNKELAAAQGMLLNAKAQNQTLMNAASGNFKENEPEEGKDTGSESPEEKS